ncbi:MAG: DUF4397 domain-containing protein [Armatimonadota bacterium]|nr:DUF4397 domain-containing protein [Armatimonadota bacterium]
MQVVIGTMVIVVALGLSTGLGQAQSGTARVRVVHASPDAPAVDVVVDGTKAISGLAFKAISAYATVPAGQRKFQVFPAGTTMGTPVIEVTPSLAAGKDYTVVAFGRLAGITPGLVEDDNRAPAAGKARIRFIHGSPNAPAVDIAVTGGPVIFPNVAFKAASGYAEVDAGTYNLEARAAGTSTVALAVPGVRLEAGRTYTVIAVGLLNGTPALSAILTADL